MMVGETTFKQCFNFICRRGFNFQKLGIASIWCIGKGDLHENRKNSFTINISFHMVTLVKVGISLEMWGVTFLASNPPYLQDQST